MIPFSIRIVLKDQSPTLRNLCFLWWISGTELSVKMTGLETSLFVVPTAGLYFSGNDRKLIDGLLLLDRILESIRCLKQTLLLWNRLEVRFMMTSTPWPTMKIPYGSVGEFWKYLIGRFLVYWKVVLWAVWCLPNYIYRLVQTIYICCFMQKTAWKTATVVESPLIHKEWSCRVYFGVPVSSSTHVLPYWEIFEGWGLMIN